MLKKIVLAAAAVATLGTAASAEYIRVSSNAAYTATIAIENEEGVTIDFPVVSTFGQVINTKVKPGTTFRWNTYNLFGGSTERAGAWEVKEGYDIRLHYTGSIFNPSYSIKYEPTIDRG